ncbi:MAG: metalloregulator ArsR/SmtB family transcription factor [Bacteroidales bacterium]|nr:metalloregulator ArsR/SmtB family transcription factor [Bacteroidales bacterium]
MGKKIPTTRNRPGRPPSAESANSSGQDRTLRELANIFKSLSDPNRLKILQLLIANGEMHVSSISEELNQSQPAVSHHLTQLRSSGLIEFRRDGKFNYYTISPNGLSELFGQLFPSGTSPKVQVGGVELSTKWKG